jgi:HAD superfamily hydrolase (TIGR01509 family)
MQPLRGVLLDIDGTLLNSNDAHAASWVDVLAERGGAVRFETVRPLIGMGGDKIMKILTGLEEKSDEAQAISARRRRIFLERYLPDLAPFDGARELLTRMRDDGLARVVATSASGEELDALLRRARVDDLIQGASSSDAGPSKPDPDVVHAAVERSGLSPSELIMIGDTPYDVEAARRAGVDAIALRSGEWDVHALAGAVAIYRDARELVRTYDASPLALRRAT